jgi:hypothetical protein
MPTLGVVPPIPVPPHTDRMHPDTVHETLRRHLLVDGFDLVLDTRASRGSWLVDARDGRRWLDLFSFFASSPLGMNHTALVDDPGFLAELAEVAVNKPSNSDVYSVRWRGSSRPSPGSSGTPRCRTCSSWTAARSPSRTR